MSTDRPVGRLEARLSRLYGPTASRWVKDIARLTAVLEAEWGIEIGRPFRSMAYGYVAPGTRDDGTKVVLKLRYPVGSIRREAEALQAYSGLGAVSLLGVDYDRGAILVERVEPGIDAARLSDDAAIRAFCSIAGQIHAAPPEGSSFPTVEEWGRGFERHRQANQGGPGPIPPDLFSRGEELYRKLSQSQHERVLLHGDLHHANMLLSEKRGWLAIDPQGVLGERAYEAGAFLRNPIDQLPHLPGLHERMAARIEQIALRCEYPAERVAGWGFSQAVLSAIWALEDHEPQWAANVEVARSLLSALG